MEASSVIMMNPSSSSSSCSFKKHGSSSTMGFAPPSSFYKRSSLNMGGFCDKGQLEYYRTSVRIRCKEVKVEEKKKKKKLVKGLARDLSVFYGMGFGLDSEYYLQKQLNHEGVVDQVKFKMMSEAAELLLQQLREVRAEEKELKKKMKMEEKRKMKAEKKSSMESSSSSSSSESSDSESDNEAVVDLKRLKGGLQAPQQQQSLPGIVPTLQEDGDVSLLPTAAAAAVLEETYRREADVVSGIGMMVNQENNRVGAELGGMVGKKIEVCMGGKCKKSGAATLVEEFQRVVGFNPDIAVSGCKCMGKCKEGPNVRVVNSLTSEDVPVAPKAPLCLGVGVEDVGLIVSNFYGDETQQAGGVMGVPAPAL